MTNLFKNIPLILAGIGAGLSSFIGGWDMTIKILILLMAIDFITGLLIALFFKNSPKTETGTASSKQCFIGIIKKVCMLLCVAVGVMLDQLTGNSGACRAMIILFFVGCEGLSIVENMGLMGVPLPKFIKKAFAVLKETNNEKK